MAAAAAGRGLSPPDRLQAQDGEQLLVGWEARSGVGHQGSPYTTRQPEWNHNGCNADPSLVAAMAKTLTLKNLPEALHARLTAAAKRHRRSLNNEAILCLEAGLGTAIPTAEEELTRLRALRGSLGPHVFDPDAIDVFKREGRP